MSRDEIDLSNLGDIELLELFSVADEQGLKEYAGEALDEYFRRFGKHFDSSPTPISSAPKTGILGVICRRSSHQVRGGGGG
jgi:hypothetical protein